MERKKDKKVLKSKTLPPRKTYPAEFDDFDFFSSTDSSTDWEVRSDSNTNWTFTPPIDPLIYPVPHPCPINFCLGGGVMFGFDHIRGFYYLACILNFPKISDILCPNLF